VSESRSQQTSLLDLLDKLVEPGDPPPVSMMPQTWGWGALAIAVIILAVLAGFRLYRSWRANAYRRSALGALAQAQGVPEEIAAIVRRTALAAFPRKDVAGLTGADWLHFLRTTCKGSPFDGAAGEALTAAPYRDVPPSAELETAAARWIRSHRREGSR